MYFSSKKQTGLTINHDGDTIDYLKAMQNPLVYRIAVYFQ